MGHYRHYRHRKYYSHCTSEKYFEVLYLRKLNNFVPPNTNIIIKSLQLIDPLDS